MCSWDELQSGMSLRWAYVKALTTVEACAECVRKRPPFSLVDVLVVWARRVFN